MSRDVRLIDVDEAIEKINCLCTDSNENWIGTDNQSFVDHADVIDILSDMPTLDAMEVVHGRWIVEVDGNFRNVKCSACGKDYACHIGMLQLQNLSYCPNCGAKMDLE